MQNLRKWDVINISFTIPCKQIKVLVTERRVNLGHRNHLPIKKKCDVHFWTPLKITLRDLDGIQNRIMRMSREI